MQLAVILLTSRRIIYVLCTKEKTKMSALPDVDIAAQKVYTIKALNLGEMSEWFKVLAWNAGVR